MSNTTRRFLMAAAGGKKSTYVDDVFHTEVFKSTNQNADYKVTNNIDNAGEGGFLWYKQRNGSSWHLNWDTARGSNKYIYTNSTSGESTSELLKSFDSDGYTIKTGTTLVDPARENVLWNFRKAEGFFDIVTWSGNDTAGRQIPHNLGSIPGCIMVKKTSGAESWEVYHRGADVTAPQNYRLRLNSNAPRLGTLWNNTAPTATHFTLSSANNVNGSGDTYVAYIFAGGASDEPGAARSVDFDGNDALTLATSSDLSLGTGDYTIEFWFNADAINDSPLFENRVSGNASDTTGFTLTAHGSTNGVRIWWNGASRINGGGSKLNLGQWHHLAATRSSGTTYLFLDGALLGTTTDAINVTTTEAHIAGGKYGGSASLSHYFNGRISNFRLIKGTALYTTSFNPSTTGLTSVTNTKLLCCNKNTVTGSTVTPSTISSVGNPQSSTSTPFDDPNGFQFGEEGDQNIIKCGSWEGVGGNPYFDVDLGWEPQFLIVKNIGLDGANNEWLMFDSMRGVVTGPNTSYSQGYGGNDARLSPTESATEYTGGDYVEFYPRGVRIVNADGRINGNGSRVAYIAIRRPDGYVGKPAESASDVFSVTTGTGGAEPQFVTGFPMDFAMVKEPAAAANWHSGARLTGNDYMHPNLNDSVAGQASWLFGASDNMNGFAHTYYSSTTQAWSWKRHAGFDFITYKGNGENGHAIPHSLNKVPEMIWVKRRDTNGHWTVYHVGANSGSNPQNWALYLNLGDPNYDWTAWNDTMPTSTHFSLGTSSYINHPGSNYIAMLWSSVAGISKCGYYAGSGSTQTITTGFQPRFIIVKVIDNTLPWYVLDTTRGWAAGNDSYLQLNENVAQVTNFDFGAPTATGFTMQGGAAANNESGLNYVYYAHA